MGGLRVGLHTGPMVAGSLGTGARMEFCLLGDTANIGARLEQLGKDYAEPSPRYCTIVVGEPTWSRLAGAFPGLRHRRYAAARPAYDRWPRTASMPPPRASRLRKRRTRQADPVTAPPPTGFQRLPVSDRDEPVVDRQISRPGPLDDILVGAFS